MSIKYILETFIEKWFGLVFHVRVFPNSGFIDSATIVVLGVITVPSTTEALPAGIWGTTDEG